MDESRCDAEQEVTKVSLGDSAILELLFFTSALVNMSLPFQEMLECFRS